MMRSPSGRLDPGAHRGGHVALGADRDRGHHGAAGGPALLARDVADRHVQHAREDGLEGARAGSTAGDPDLVRRVAHRLVAVARREPQALVDAAHQVDEAGPGREAGEHRARTGLDERPALAGLVDVGVEQRGCGPRLEHARIEGGERRLAPDLVAEHARGLARARDDPVDVQRRRHVGLHLRDAARHRERHGVAGRLRRELDLIGARAPAHVHAGGADDRAADGAARIVEAAAEPGAQDVEKTEADGRAGAQAGRARRLGGQRMGRLAAIQHRRQQRAQLGDAQSLEHRVGIAAGAKVAEGEGAFRAVRGPHAGEVEVEPVLAMKGGGRARQDFRARDASARPGARPAGRRSGRSRCGGRSRRARRPGRAPRRSRRRDCRATARRAPPAVLRDRSARCRRPGP